MNFRAYLIPVLSVLALIGFVWVFTKVVIYLLIASVLTLLCKPLVTLFSKIKFGKFHLPDTLVALLTIVSAIASVIFISSLFLPVLIHEIKFLSTLSFSDVFTDILNQFPRLRILALNFGTEQEIADAITVQVNAALNFKNISTLLNGFVSTTGTFIGGTLAVLFITFFLLKEDRMVFRSLLLVTPSDYEEKIKDILRSTQTLLSKYFLGLLLDVLIVSTTVTVCMYILGIQNAVLIGVFTGLMNIIPYVGPLISFGFATTLGITGCIEYGQVNEISSVIAKIFFVLLGMNMIDGFIIQPYIFSNSVKAHPLEIFLVILMAASIAGIWGMVVAIPTYTLLRIIAREFLVNFKFFKKITESISQAEEDINK